MAKRGMVVGGEAVGSDVAGKERPAGLRIAALIVEPIAYRLVAAWAERHGHRLALLVTTPGPPHTWHNRDYHDLVGIVPATQDVLVTTRMRRVVAPVLGVLAPDFVLSFTFPYRVPAEVIAVPRFGAVNLHPTPLPAFRGPNPRRMLLDGVPTLGAALHRLEARFDAGAILSCHERPFPRDPTPERVLDEWLAVLDEALEEGTARAIAGEWGEPQDETRASYAAPFTAEERRLDWSRPVAELSRRSLALSLFHPEARAEIGGRLYGVARLTPSPASAESLPPPGTVVAAAGERLTIAAGDGLVDVAVVALDDFGNQPPGRTVPW